MKLEGHNLLLAELREQAVQFCPVVTTPSRSIDFFNRLKTGEGYFIGAQTDNWTIFPMQFVDAKPSIRGEFLILDP